MKPSLKTFGFSRMKMKFHIYADTLKFEKVLNENIDTLVGLNEEVFAEGFDYHKKKYKGVIRDNFFEITSKHIIGVLRTYNPWVIRGDFESVGSNIELALSLKRSKSLLETLFLFALFPLIALVTIITDKVDVGISFTMFGLCIAIPICYHLISRWMQFSTLLHFFQLIDKTTTTSQIPN